jgi:hypothetical protein
LFSSFPSEADEDVDVEALLLLFRDVVRKDKFREKKFSPEFELCLGGSLSKDSTLTVV